MKPVIVRLLPCLPRWHGRLRQRPAGGNPLPPARTRPAERRQPAMPALAVTVEQAAWLNGLAMHYQLDAQRPQLARYRDSLWPTARPRCWPPVCANACPPSR